MGKNLPAKIEQEPDVVPAGSPSILGRFRWLISPDARTFLLPLTGVWILGLDWLLFSEEVLSLGLAIPIVVVIGFLLGGAGTFFLQQFFARDTFATAAFKAMLAGLVVGAPWPMTGTVVGAWILLLAGLQRGKTTVSDKETK